MSCSEQLPLFACSVAAGFPSPADDFLEGRLSLDELCIRRPAATFFVKASGESMIEAGIFPGDVLVVDRSLKPLEGNVVVACLDGEFTVKRLAFEQGRPILMPENPSFPPLVVQEGQDFCVWGVVSYVIHCLHP